jgi:hypothetical protein
MRKHPISLGFLLWNTRNQSDSLKRIFLQIVLFWCSNIKFQTESHQLRIQSRVAIAILSAIGCNLSRWDTVYTDNWICRSSRINIKLKRTGRLYRDFMKLLLFEAWRCGYIGSIIPIKKWNSGCSPSTFVALFQIELSAGGIVIDHSVSIFLWNHCSRVSFQPIFNRDKLP